MLNDWQFLSPQDLNFKKTIIYVLFIAAITKTAIFIYFKKLLLLKQYMFKMYKNVF